MSGNCQASVNFTSSARKKEKLIDLSKIARKEKRKKIIGANNLSFYLHLASSIGFSTCDKFWKHFILPGIYRVPMRRYCRWLTIPSASRFIRTHHRWVHTCSGNTKADLRRQNLPSSEWKNSTLHLSLIFTYRILCFSVTSRIRQIPSISVIRN